MFELQELRILLAVVDQGGFQKAAERLFLTQPAVSQSIKNLERKVGQELLERTHPPQPTAIGAELVRHGRFILERENEFISDLTRLKKGHLLRLNLVFDYLINEYHGCRYVLQTLKHWPELTLKIKRLPGRDMIQAVADGAFDLAIGPFQKSMDDLKTHKLFDITSYLVTSKKNPDLRLYRQDPLAFLRESVLFASYIDQPALRPSKVKIRDYFSSAWEIDNMAMQLQLISEGIGVTYVPESMLADHKDLLVLEKIPFCKVSKPYGIYHRQQLPLNEAAQTLIREATKMHRYGP